MKTWRADYWRMFNVLVRVLGLTALVSGTVFTILGISRVVQPGAMRIEGEPGLMLLLVGLWFAFGWRHHARRRTRHRSAQLR